MASNVTHTLAQASSAVAKMEDALRRAHEENKLLEQRLQEAKQVRYSTYVCTKHDIRRSMIGMERCS